jgi:hypothetical protein
MCMERSVTSVLAISALLLFAETIAANPIAPARMPREELTIQIDSNRQAAFDGSFTFDFIPRIARSMLFPIPPENAGGIEVYQDDVAIPWTMSGRTYPTALSEYPELSMFEWNGPFPQQGAVFRVKYQHDLFMRDGNWVLVYPLSSETYFQTSAQTTAKFNISFPSTFSLADVNLDGAALDPSLYTLTDTGLDMTLTSSRSNPFRRNLVVIFAVPEPGSAWLLLGAMLLGLSQLSRRERWLCSDSLHRAPTHGL